MTEFHRCPECARYLAPYSLFVSKILRQVKRQQTANKDPERIMFDSNMSTELGPLFDALKIPLPCCRMHLFTKVDFTEIYK
jgi:DNA-directed RNA polymerase subunit N (RpoN/RPB10)